MATTPLRNLPPKQLAHLAQIIVLIFLASLFFRIRIWEADAHRNDFEAIASLNAIFELPTHQLLTENHTAESFKYSFDTAIQPAVIQQLAAGYNTVDGSRRKVRDEITNWLTAAGLPEVDASQLSGKGKGDQYPFLFFKSNVEKLESPFSIDARIDCDPFIELLLAEAEQIRQPYDLMVATGIQGQLPTLDLSIDQNSFRRNSYQFLSVVLTDSSELSISFEENIGAGQINPKYKNFKIPVTTASISDVPILSTLTQGKLANSFLTGDIRRRLSASYGQLRLQQALDVTSKRMLDSHQDVEMLGFKFPPKTLWVFVFCFVLAALVASVIHVRAAPSNSELTMFGINQLLLRRDCRILFWLALPCVSLLLSYPSGQLSASAILAFWIGFTVVVAAGCVLLSISLFTQRSS